MQSLQTLIDLLENGTRLHISILDLTGILTYPQTQISTESSIHSKCICDTAKSTQKGYEACMMNKAKANNKALTEGVGFCGHCVYGIFEYALPVVINGRVSAIIYVGNAIIDRNKTEKKIKRACESTGVHEEKLKAHLDACEKITSPKKLEQIAEIISDYLKLLYKDCEKSPSDIHWLVTVMKHYAAEHLSNRIQLSDVAAIYNRNEKYLGRLFKAETGISFSEYCNEHRLKKAHALISDGNRRIIDVAAECGFENVTYFNRLFKKKYGVPPTKI